MRLSNRTCRAKFFKDLSSVFHVWDIDKVQKNEDDSQLEKHVHIIYGEVSL
jgi:hypothetical protein